MVAAEVKNCGGAASVATCDVEDLISCGYLVGSEMFLDKKVGVVKEAKTIGEDEDEANPYRNCRVTPG